MKKLIILIFLLIVTICSYGQSRAEKRYNKRMVRIFGYTPINPSVQNTTYYDRSGRVIGRSKTVTSRTWRDTKQSMYIIKYR